MYEHMHKYFHTHVKSASQKYFMEKCASGENWVNNYATGAVNFSHLRKFHTHTHSQQQQHTLM